MPQNIWNLDWLNANAQRRYPLTEDSSGQDSTQTFTLPNDFLVALDLPIHAGLDVDPAGFFIKQLGVYATGFGVVIAYQPAVGAAINVATALIPRQTHVPNTTYALGGVDDFADTVGKITVGRLDGIDAQPSGLFEFVIGDARVEPDCIRPIIRGISSITVASGTQRSQRMYGDIELVAEENIQLVPVIVSGQDPQILISAIKGEGLVEECVCEGNETGPAVKRINGIPPTPAGDFTLLGNVCLTLEPIKNGLRLRDVCSEPCCGCEELEAVTRDLEKFGEQYATLNGFMTRLEAAVSQMDQVVLGSKIGDRGCVTCE